MRYSGKNMQLWELILFSYWPAVFWPWGHQPAMSPFWEHLPLHLYQDLPYIVFGPLFQLIHCDNLEHGHKDFGDTSRYSPIHLPLPDSRQLSELWSGWNLNTCHLWMPAVFTGHKFPLWTKSKWGSLCFSCPKSMSQGQKCGQWGWGTRKLGRGPRKLGTIFSIFLHMGYVYTSTIECASLVLLKLASKHL